MKRLIAVLICGGAALLPQAAGAGEVLFLKCVYTKSYAVAGGRERSTQQEGSEIDRIVTGGTPSWSLWNPDGGRWDPHCTGTFCSFTDEKFEHSDFPSDQNTLAPDRRYTQKSIMRGDGKFSMFIRNASPADGRIIDIVGDGTCEKTRDPSKGYKKKF